MIMTSATLDLIDSTYEPFSREPEYIQANKAFIEKLPIKPALVVLDLACGTATMSDLIIERLAAAAGLTGRAAADYLAFHGFQLFGIDLSEESLALGRQHLASRWDLQRNGRDTLMCSSTQPFARLAQGTAERVGVPTESIDLAIMGNAIQLVEQRDNMYSEIHRALRPGGTFAFNTSFYAGTYCEGTEQVYLRWVQEASRWIADKNQALKAAGQPGIQRIRGTSHRAFSRPWLSIADYRAELERHGLEVYEVYERTVMLNQRCFETIGAYTGLSKVLLSGYPGELASRALIEASGITLEASGVTEIPRFWLEMSARKLR
jgi:ubiquinone/menaquinone biosynthesis C-methylase UbiE